MKPLLFFSIMFALATAAKCQDFVLNMDQAGLAYRNSRTGRFGDAEVKDSKATIVLQNNVVMVSDSPSASYILNYKSAEKKTGNAVVTRQWKGMDDKKLPILFKLTVNLQSKEAMVEVAYEKLKSYYFGTYTSSELSNRPLNTRLNN